MKSDNVLRYMQCAQVMEGFLSITCVFSKYLFYRNFLFYIYDKTFYGLSNDILHVMGTWLFLCVLAT